jgi:transcriptional regulator with XRE-family HTH domain
MTDVLDAARRFSPFLVTELTKRKMSQRDLARATGINPSLINRYVNGIHVPDGINLYRIADALNLDANIVREAAGLNPAQPKAPGTTETRTLVSLVERINWRILDREYSMVEAQLQWLIDRQEREDTDPKPGSSLTAIRPDDI